MATKKERIAQRRREQEARSRCKLVRSMQNDTAMAKAEALTSGNGKLSEGEAVAYDVATDSRSLRNCHR